MQNLKTTPRTGWVKRGVKQPESIADHMYRMGMMALVMGDAGEGLDMNRAIRIALVHDAAEALVGDITPHCGVGDDDKHAMEAAAIAKMKAMLGGTTRAAQDVEALWYEYENQSSAEARLVKDFDKLEMILQAHEYEQSQGLPLNEFFESTAGKFRTPVGQALDAEIRGRRAAAASAAEPKEDAAAS